MSLRIVLILMGLIAFIFGGAAGAYLQARALGSQNRWADVQKIFMSPKNSPQSEQTNPTNHPNDPIQGDAHHRLIQYPNKIEVACPVQTERTMVLLISGQSNSANHGGQRFESAYGDKVLNYFNGKCYIAKSPLLGATGLEGESWTLLGNELIKNHKADRVIIASTGVAGSSIKQWQVGDAFQKSLMNDYKTLAKQYHPTHFLWHQGETDFVNQTTQGDYERVFAELMESLRAQGMTAPIYLSLASQCWMNTHWTTDNPIRQAQNHLITTLPNTRRGVDSDVLLGELDRFDNCHFAGTGQVKFAQAWMDVLQ